MKKIYLFCLLFVSVFSSAQVINFPATNFKLKLLESSPTNQIAKNLSNNYFKIDVNNNNEIEISEALQVSYLDINNSSQYNITGIESFTNLTNLNCSNNYITNLNLSHLSNLINLNCANNQLANLNITNLINLINLNCSGNQLTNLNFSNSTNLSILNCEFNQFSSLNISNLTNLSELICNYNQLTNLNASNLSNLTKLECHENQLTTLNVSNLTDLSELICSSNQLTILNISNLPNLTKLECQGNNLTTLDVANLTNLTILSCAVNQLSNIDVSNLTNLTLLNCDSNQLTNLNISNLINLTHLGCQENQLTTLNVSNLSNLIYLACTSNQLTFLDVSNLPNLNFLACHSNQLEYINIKNGSQNTLNDFYFSDNPNLQYICADDIDITSVQNKITDYGYTNCQVNSYCTFTPGGQFYTIQGQHKFDDENNGCDYNDVFIPNLKFNISDGTTSGSIISNYSGIYSIPVQAGNHTITPVLENPTYFNASPSNVVVNFPTQASPYTQDFCITPNGIKHDVEVSIIPINPARPGFDVKYKIIFKNKGNQTENGTVNLQFDDTVLDLVSVNPTFSTQTLNNLNWTYSNLQPFETREIIVTFNVNSPLETPAVNAGDFLIYTAQITQLGTDEMISDNSFGLKQLVVNSYDPNDKTCLQGNFVGPDKIGEYVHYTIRFENTGTYPAQNIVVKDMIDTAKFDVSTLVPLNASHNFFTRISGNKVEFIFENINLPFDDASNDGYIAFKIKTKPTLVLGDTFSNSANIYFDYNFPITTNTYTTTIAALSNPSFELDNYFNLYPNPTSNELTIHLKQAIEINSIQIYNTIGQLVQVQTGNASKVDVSNLKTGNYFIKINTSSGYSTSQFIKN